jgi:hypothetical protein
MGPSTPIDGQVLKNQRGNTVTLLQWKRRSLSTDSDDKIERAIESAMLQWGRPF